MESMGYMEIRISGSKGNLDLSPGNYDIREIIAMLENAESLLLEDYNKNILYKTFGIRASGKQHATTGEIDTATLKFIELIDYQPRYDEVYLKHLRDRARQSWVGKIDADQCLHELRGGYDA